MGFITVILGICNMFEISVAIPLKQLVGMERLGVFEISFVHWEDKELTIPASIQDTAVKVQGCPDLSSENI